MSTQFPEDSDSAQADDAEDGIWSSRDEIRQWLEQLRHSDRSLYNLMALEVWSLAQTMDHLVPGFWNRFMENRQLALKEFLEQRHAQPEEDGSSHPEFARPDEEEREA